MVPPDVLEKPSSKDADLLKELQKWTYVKELESIFSQVDFQRLVPDLTAGSSEVQVPPRDCVFVKGLCEFRLSTDEGGLHEDEGVDGIANLSWEA